MAEERDACSLDYVQDDDCRLMRTILGYSRDGIRVYDLAEERFTYIHRPPAEL